MKFKIIVLGCLLLIPLSTFAGDLKVMPMYRGEGKNIQRILKVVSQDEKFEYTSTNFTNNLTNKNDDYIVKLRTNLAQVAQTLLDMSSCQQKSKDEDTFMYVNTFDNRTFDSLKECRQHIADEADEIIYHGVLLRDPN